MARRNRQVNDLEARLRANRPEPPSSLVDSLVSPIEASRRESRRRTTLRASFAGALTLALLGALASFGALSYAAVGTADAVKAVKRVVSFAPSKPQAKKRTAASSQYGQEKVTLCHHAANGKRVTITVARAAVPAHLRHGDTPGPC